MIMVLNPVVFALTLVQCPQGRDKRGPATA